MTSLERVAARVVGMGPDELPAAVVDQAKKIVANWFAAAVAGARSAEGATLAAAVAELGTGAVPLVGTARRLQPPAAALGNGALAHVEDFDDTHLETVAHAGTPVLGALTAALRPGVSGRDWIAAAALGVEVSIRAALLLHPEHYDRGWHVTASVGGIGAAFACARLWRLPAEQAANAGALAALQPVGLRAAFGTGGKAFQVGRAAEAGYTASVLAGRGVDGPRHVLEHPRGLCITTATPHPEAFDGLGERWELLRDTFKPYPCGVVTHPLIDAGLALHARGTDPARIAALRVRVHPLVVELTGLPAPARGLAGKFSAAQLLATAIHDGRVDVASFPAEPAEAVVRLAGRVQLTPDAGVAQDACRLAAELHSGEVVTETVEHARGSLERPLLWDDIERKFAACAGGWLPAADRLWAALRDLEAAADAAALLELATVPD